jgi:nitrile hydratase
MTDDDDPAARIAALEAILVEKHLVDPAAVDRIIDQFETAVGPMLGARVIARAWTDAAYRARLLADGRGAAAELGIAGIQAEHLKVVENTATRHNVVACTLCSCYPWAVLGLPPSWYKSPEYRSRIVREPRAVLAELGLALPPEVEIVVWDSSAELRYLVLPERPAGTEGWTEDQLAAVVTRDAMIGVATVRAPATPPPERS